MQGKGTELLKAVRAFNLASLGDSGDEEYEAALEMRDQILEYLRLDSARSIELAENLDEFDEDDGLTEE